MFFFIPSTTLAAVPLSISNIFKNVDTTDCLVSEKNIIHIPNCFFTLISVDSSTSRLNILSPISIRKLSLKYEYNTFFTTAVHLVLCNFNLLVAVSSLKHFFVSSDKWSMGRNALCHVINNDKLT